MSDGRENDEARRPTWLSENVPADVVTSGLFRFRVVLLSGAVVSVDVSNDVEIDYERLEEQMDQVPGQYVWWASVYSEAKSMVTLVERRIKARRGTLIDAALQEARARDVRLTDKQVERVVEADEKLNELEVKLAKMQASVGKLYHMMKAIEMKSELLRSRSGFKRQEMEQQR